MSSRRIALGNVRRLSFSRVGPKVNSNLVVDKYRRPIIARLFLSSLPISYLATSPLHSHIISPARHFIGPKCVPNFISFHTYLGPFFFLSLPISHLITSPTHWISSLDFHTGFPHWISPLDFPTGFPHWISPLDFQHWISPLDFPIGFPHWISTLDFPIGFPHWISTLNFHTGFPHWIPPLDFPT